MYYICLKNLKKTSAAKSHHSNPHKYRLFPCNVPSSNPPPKPPHVKRKEKNMENQKESEVNQNEQKQDRKGKRVQSDPGTGEYRTPAAESQNSGEDVSIHEV